MMKIIKTIVIAIAAVVMTSATPVAAQGFLSGLFGGGDDSGSCGETKTHFVSCDGDTGVAAIGDIIRIITIIMTILIGLVATGALGYAGMLYASARDDKEKVAEALRVVRNVVVGLLLYVFTVAIISWLLPGSVIQPSPEPTPTTSATPSPSPTVSPSTSP